MRHHTNDPIKRAEHIADRLEKEHVKKLRAERLCPYMGYWIDHFIQIKKELCEGMVASRKEHLAWCKARALVYVDSGNVEDAFASMSRDLCTHPETCNHPGIKLGMMVLMSKTMTSAEMRNLINNFT